MEPMKPMEPIAPTKPTKAWRPDDLSQPSASGAQDGTRSAFFPQKSRLLIERSGEISTYGSGDHQITRVQRGGGGPGFASQNGEVDLDRLKRID